MKRLMKPIPLLTLLTACGSTLNGTQVNSVRSVPPRGTVNEFGQIKITQPNEQSYTLEVIPFMSEATYSVIVSESPDTTAECELFPSDVGQILRVERKSLNANFLHFARVCVYFDQGDSGASSLMLANDKLFVAISRETLGHY